MQVRVEKGAQKVALSTSSPYKKDLEGAKNKVKKPRQSAGQSKKCKKQLVYNQEKKLILVL